MTDLSKVSNQLAKEIAAQISPLNDILNKFGIDAVQFAVINNTAQFRQLLLEAKAQWNSTNNAKERIRSYADAVAEDGLLVMHEIIQDKDATPSARIDAHKHVTSISNAAATKVPLQAISDRFTIEIHIGADKQSITGDVTHKPDKSNSDDTISAAAQTDDNVIDADQTPEPTDLTLDEIDPTVLPAGSEISNFDDDPFTYEETERGE